MNFTHLHCHTHYSILDGAAKINDLVDRAKSLGMTALAITDHGNMYGVIDFYKACTKAGIKPIIGYEAYMANGSRLDRDPMRRSNTHITLLAQNNTGYQNLLKMASSAYLDSFYYKPRIDEDLLFTLSDGVICLSGCASSAISRCLRQGDYDSARNTAESYQLVFGDRYYLEVQDTGLDFQATIIDGIIRISQELRIPIVATNDIHYPARVDAEAQDLLLCINTNAHVYDKSRFKMDGSEYYLKSYDEMLAAFPEMPYALDMSNEIAERCNVTINLATRHFPVCEVPKNQTPEVYLRELCYNGLVAKYKYGALPIHNRLHHELEVINKLGFANYFLIVYDIMEFARKHNILATARGSAAGSLVSYVLGISNICPIEHGLLFERFLDENRLEAPDIDIDFERERRDEVLAYAREKYGESHVAQICNFGTLGAKSSIRDAGRALGMPLSDVNAMIEHVPDELNIKLYDAMVASSELRTLCASSQDAANVILAAEQVEGLVRNAGTHACAVVIADKPLEEYLPLQKIGGDGDVVTQFCGKDVEAIGLLKMDVLGLKNLSIIAHALKLIKANTGEVLYPWRLPTKDEATFALLCAGDTKGVFQLEGDGMCALLRRMKPDSVADIAATISLYRPGPLEGGMVDDYIRAKNKIREPRYLHPIMESVLSSTYGVMVYQEQIMEILHQLGNMHLSRAYSCIKAIGKKIKKDIEAFRAEFINGAQANVTAEVAGHIFDLVEKFARYGFNKSHATAYAMISYITAYLKAHYPAEYMAALLTSDMQNRNFTIKDAVVQHINDCKRIDMAVWPPNINLSHSEFTAIANRIQFGLAAIKGCGKHITDKVVQERMDNGNYKSLRDFCTRTNKLGVNKRMVEALIKSGAMDQFGGRDTMLVAMQSCLAQGRRATKDAKTGQQTLFDVTNDRFGIENVTQCEWDDYLTDEREVLGCYMTGSPLDEYTGFIGRWESEAVKIGQITDLYIGTLKKSRPGCSNNYAKFTIEGLHDDVQCIMWPEAYDACRDQIHDGFIVLCEGKAKNDANGNTFVVEAVYSMDEVAHDTEK